MIPSNTWVQELSVRPVGLEPIVFEARLHEPDVFDQVEFCWENWFFLGLVEVISGWIQVKTIYFEATKKQLKNLVDISCYIFPSSHKVDEVTS